MAYKQEEIDSIFKSILFEIEQGASLRSVLLNQNTPSSKTFYEWLEADEQKVKRYAHACEARELKILDEIIEIADKQGEDVVEKDGKSFVNHNIIQRNALQIEARKWTLGKLNPNKYGNNSKHVLEGGDKPIEISFED